MNSQNQYSQIVIIGGTGQIGHRFIESFLKSDRKYQILATSRKVTNERPDSDLAKTVINKINNWQKSSISKLKWVQFDLDSSNESLDKSIQELNRNLDLKLPTVFIIAAAFTNVEACEMDPEKCNRINRDNTLKLLNFANSIKSKIIFNSTDYVFDGKSGPYFEHEKRNAISVYGNSKVAIEEWLEKNTSNSLIVRTTGVFDYIPGTKSFVMQMLDYWKLGQRTKVPSDQFSNPIWAKDIVTATNKLIEKDSKGIFGVGGGSYLARSEFAKLISEVFGYGANLIDPIKTSDLNQKAKRPLMGGLKNDKLINAIQWQPMTARDALVHLRDHVMKEY